VPGIILSSSVDIAWSPAGNIAAAALAAWTRASRLDKTSSAAATLDRNKKNFGPWAISLW
jgi:hypothetical protein